MNTKKFNLTSFFIFFNLVELLYNLNNYLSKKNQGYPVWVYNGCDCGWSSGFIGIKGGV